MRAFSFLLMPLMVIALMGCGKTLDQIKNAAHALVDIGVKAYEDGRDNFEAAKKVIEGEPAPDPPAEPVPGQ